VILTLGLGIGANAAMFGVVDRLMFRPHPMLRDPSAVHRVYLSYTHQNTVHTNSYTEYARYLDLARWTPTLSQHAAYTVRRVAIGTGTALREYDAATVSASFFDFFDAPPALGRYFTPDEDRVPRGADVVVLSHGFWLDGFGGRNVVGEPLQVGGISATIIGVAPRGFQGIAETRAPALYLPITTWAGAQPNEIDRTTYYTRYDWSWMSVLVRRKPDVTVAQVSADLTQAYRQSWQAEAAMRPVAPLEIAKPEAVAAPVRRNAGPDPSLAARTSLWVAGVAGIVLLIAAANTTNLFLTRAIGRRRELAVRLAMGVSRGRLLRQSLTESLLLSGLGAVAGLLMAHWGSAVLYGALIAEAAPRPEVLTDWRTVSVAAVIALLTALPTGLAPALLSRRDAPIDLIRDSARSAGSHRTRLRTGLMIAQGALAVLLLVGAGLFVRSLDNVRTYRLGYEADQVLLAFPNLRGTVLDDSSGARLGRTMLEAAQAMPGVQSASSLRSVPLLTSSSMPLFVAGIDSVSRLGRFSFQAASGDYFTTMGTRILRGRGFSGEDRAGSPPIVIVDEAMASALWPGQDALGQCIRLDTDTSSCTTVVGVAENVTVADLGEAQPYHYYLPMEQQPVVRVFALAVRVQGDMTAAQEGLRRALQAEMPGQAYVTVQPMASVVDGQRRSWQLGATLFSAFGGLALLVAAIGLYGVIAYNVAQRMHELGIRMALGASRRNVVSLVVVQAIRFAGFGILIGLAIALAAGGLIEPLLFQQSARDPVVLLGVALVLALVALLASLAPASRAVRADPNAALRSD
ncbi:MAG: ADOP family duplicated permease, partial [Gemmatimonadales bacterium]